MPRTLTIRCTDCRERFMGDETMKRHRILAGDRYRCLTPSELRARNYYYRAGAWHRGASLLPSTTVTLWDADTTAVSVGQGYPPALYNGSPPSEPVSTSEAAAASMKFASNSIRKRVYDLIQAKGDEGVTDDELEQIMGLRHQTVSARRRELYLLGKIQTTGERRTRSGRRAKVWVVR